MKKNVKKTYPPLSRDILIKIGKCCSNFCENCPYTKPIIKGNRELE